MAYINVLPLVISSTPIIYTPNTSMCPSNAETTSPLTPFCAVSPHCSVPVSKIQVQITLETIYEKEDEEEDEMEKSSETLGFSSPPILSIQAATCSFEIGVFSLFGGVWSQLPACLVVHYSP